MIISYTELCNKVKAMIKPSRFEHSIGVSETAFSLAKRFNLDAEAAKYCGIYHDAYRYAATEDSIAFCRQNGWTVFPEEEKSPMLLHGTIAAINFPKDAGDVPYSYQLAVRHHTLGSVEMGLLGALMYISDYIEPGRKHLGEEERRAILSKNSLENMIILIMDMQRDYFVRSGIEEAEVSKELYRYLSSGGRLE